ncbi:Putative peptide methionine sulfoxide reductase MsrA domain-containing protein [Colletotrichum destructivum]|uniref:peptide-methionine (S)-S-oxide reductase n=1 Tax=Colletotrichum destructivum TaxID=34406 RepID=A0AAX4IUP4_9PEZI|nr:Putative peptide methionine sulfoxide reductase MsrA domain-containing protein [Colletotrichum destructivum]
MISNFFSRLARPFTSSTTMSVNPSSNSAAAAAAGPTIPEGAQKATIAAGCFWGVEHLYRKHFQGKGLIDARVGYIGGDLANPTYRAVCGGDTGHAEALQVVFQPADVSYRQLLEFFYRMHDPTTANRQGPDTGPQYRSAIFFHDAEQEKVAREVTRLANEQWYGGKIVTDVIPAGQWWDAEQYHQLYLNKNPSGYECPSHFLRTFPPLKG